MEKEVRKEYVNGEVVICPMNPKNAKALNRYMKERLNKMYNRRKEQLAEMEYSK